MIRSRSFSLSIITLLLIISYLSASAQGRLSAGAPRTGGTSISGVVRYQIGGQPAEFVVVSLETNIGGILTQVRTDRSGKFRFDSIGQDQFRVVIRHPGYNEIQRLVDLNAQASDYLQIQLVSEKSATDSPPGKTINAGINLEAQQEFEKGRAALIDDKNVPSGIAYLEKAISLDPKYAEAHLLLSTAYLDNNQMDKAERELHKTLEITPQSATTIFLLGDVYRRQQKYAEAEKVLQDGLKLDQKSYQGHFTLGQVYFAKGDLVKAGPEIGQTLQLKPDFAEAYLLAGNLFLRARKAENALQMFEYYLQLDPKGTSAPQARELVEKIKKALAEKKP